VLRSKQNTLIIHGYAPKYPGPIPLLEEDSNTSAYELEEYSQALKQWTKKAQKVAGFYIANFMPHDEFYGDSFPDRSIEEAYGYISRLRPAPNVMAYYRGFTGNPEEGQVWNMQLALGVPN
jgi:hypothetical protein